MGDNSLQHQTLRISMTCFITDFISNGADHFHRMGELEPWIDENFVRSVWFGMGEQVNVKMIRDKFSG
jgi:hypothetical protein